MSQTKVSLMEMAEAVGDVAFTARGHVERLERDRADPLPPTDQWVRQAIRFETAYLTLSLMALDEDASRRFVSSIITAKAAEAGMLMAMIKPATSKTNPVEAAAA